ncbi:MAG: tRNA guanosine(34) transglycosylase Tgt [bacterium]
MNSCFKVIARDKATDARVGTLQTAHGEIATPVFMPVGTQGTVKTLSPQELLEVGSQIILGNTYHLYLRPGHQIIEAAGGLHEFSGWKKPILTDSGGYQVYSLSGLRKVTDDKVVFQSHHDGSQRELTPESAIDIQMSLGSDIMMVLDECPPYPCTTDYAAEAVERTSSWAKRCLHKYQTSKPKLGFEQWLFAIVQGSTSPELRRISAEALIGMDFSGYAIGGLSIGEPKAKLFEMVAICTGLLPADKPRYLMGMGKPDDIVEAVSLGVDLFDCVIPTRNGRKGQFFTWDGKINIRNACYKEDFRPVDETCECYSCLNFTRAYLRHLIHCDEILGMRMASLHNLHFYHQLMQMIRNNIRDGSFESWRQEFTARYHLSMGAE